MPEIGEIRRATEIGHKDSHRYIYISCPSCHKERWVEFIKGKAASSICLSCFLKALNADQKLGKNPNWKGGRFRDSYGYIHIKLLPDDFFYSMADQHGYVREHRLVMAKSLHRCLLSWEVVHHKDGIKDHNRPENLRLLPTATYHLIDKLTKARLRKLETEIKRLQEDIHDQTTLIRVLVWQIKELIKEGKLKL